MKLSEQVCTLEQAKKLYALGVERRSLFYHFHGRIEHEAFGSEYYSAFTVAELGVMLQKGEIGIPVYESEINTSSETFTTVSIETWITPNIFNCAIVNKEFPDRVYKECKSRYEAEARAAMLIYLLENNLVTPAEINQRLTQK